MSPEAPPASAPRSWSWPGLRQALGIPLNVALFLLLMVMGWGSAAGFFAHPVRVGESCFTC